MKNTCIKKNLVGLITALLLVFSSNLVAAQEIGNPFDIFKQGKSSTKKSSIYKPENIPENIGKSFNKAISNVGSLFKNQNPKKAVEFKTIKPVVVYEGYSEEYVKTTKRLMIQGKIKKLEKLYAQEDTNELGYLELMERGTLALAQGRCEEAEEKFALSEYILIDRMEAPKAEEWVTKFTGSLAGIISGKEDIGPYWGADYERILMLNYKTIAYLLEGDRKAYNVTRRAIDWQNIAKRAFEDKVEYAKKKLVEEEEKQEKKGYDLLAEMNIAQTLKEKGYDLLAEMNIAQTLEKIYSPMDAKASGVPNAYVNPFGFYVAGMIQEFESHKEPSLRHNARISYKKALELMPESQVLRQAVKDLDKQSHPSGKRLLHVVVGDGFAPEKKVVLFGISVKDIAVPFKLPLYEPCTSRTDKIAVYTGEGKLLTRLSPIADIEAICLRQQKDMLPLNMLRMTVVAVRTVFEKSILLCASTLGHVADTAHDEMSVCDTRSWMSLPATIQAARIYIPKSLRSVKIVTYDKKGSLLASKEVRLDQSSHNFVYARTMDDVIYAYPNKKFWLAK
jgi:hypothetical protein